MRARFVAAAVGALALALSACGGGGGGGSTPVPTGGTPVPGGKVVFALQAQTTPNYIFPFMQFQYLSVTNAAVQQQLYRPLYVFGVGDKAEVNDTLSLADPPQYSADGKTITVNLRSYKWSDGSSVDSQGVMFWMNLMKTEKSNWGMYTPGLFPDNLVSVTAPSPTQVVFTMDKAYSQDWLLYNELSQITPLPEAWDKTADNQKSDCSTNADDCPAVWTYLTNKAKNLPGYATDPLWGVVDGPFKLSEFGTDGSVAFVPNPAYSGPVKPKISEFDLKPYTSEEAEYNDLRSTNTVQIGYIPPEDVPAKPQNQRAGSNPLSDRYYLDPWLQFAINYFPINFNNPVVGPIFQQTYFRQAFQSVVDQDSVLKGPLKGYGTPTTGPVPPDSPFTSPGEQNEPFKFDINRAKQLLTSHGWSLRGNGPATCTDPGTGPNQCGAGVKGGQTLTFNLQYNSGSTWVEQSMDQLKSNASQAGIVLNLSQAPFDAVVAAATPCKATDGNCTWQMENWGGGWTYAPDYYPSGETLFQTGSGSNAGSYSDPHADQLITDSLTQSDKQSLYAYEDYLAQQVPVIWQPNADYQITEIADNLRGVSPQNPYLSFFPEYWYYVK